MTAKVMQNSLIGTNPVKEYQHRYSGYYGEEKNAVCLVSIYRGENDWQKIVVLTELPENHGLSVTNGVEKIATEIARLEGGLRSDTVWIEHYPQRGHYGEMEESFDLVTFQIVNGEFRHPAWKHLPVSKAMQIIEASHAD